MRSALSRPQLLGLLQVGDGGLIAVRDLRFSGTGWIANAAEEVAEAAAAFDKPAIFAVWTRRIGGTAPASHLTGTIRMAWQGRSAGWAPSTCSDSDTLLPCQVICRRSPSSSMARTVLPNGLISSPSNGRCCSRINELSLLVSWHQFVLRPLPTATLIGYQSETQWASKADRPAIVEVAHQMATIG